MRWKSRPQQLSVSSSRCTAPVSSQQPAAASSQQPAADSRQQTADSNINAADRCPMWCGVMVAGLRLAPALVEPAMRPSLTTMPLRSTRTARASSARSTRLWCSTSALTPLRRRPSTICSKKNNRVRSSAPVSVYSLFLCCACGLRACG
jgi:hypothetical protein